LCCPLLRNSKIEYLKDDIDGKYMTTRLNVNYSEINDKDKPIFFRIVSLISTVSGWCSAIMTLAAVVITCHMIVVRFVLNQSTVWQTEVIVYLIIGATLIGLPFVQNLRGHVNVDLVPIMLPSKARYYLAILTLLVSITVITIMLWYSYEYWHLAYTRGWTSDSITAVPLWIPHSSLLIGFSLLLLQLASELLAVILRLEKPFGLEDK
jgi:TRAP-type C4-dicarboxylate transport system permease small subunit